MHRRRRELPSERAAGGAIEKKREEYEKLARGGRARRRAKLDGEKPAHRNGRRARGGKTEHDDGPITPPLPNVEKERIEVGNAKGGGIHIKPSHKGLLHKEMGVPQGEKIGRARLEKEKAKAKREGNTAEEKRVVFAENFGH